MLSFDEAIGRLRGAIEPLGIETVPVEQAAGRFLARDLHSRLDAPRYDVSIMDGYATAERSLVPGGWLTVVGESRPGSKYGASLLPGQAVRIFTGAPVPSGADIVVMQEYAERDGANVRFRDGFGPDHHIRARSSDFSSGDVLVPKGTRLSARAMVSAGAADIAELAVSRRPRIAIIATGDELVPPGQALQSAGAQPETVSLGISALCASLGAEVVSSTHGCDDIEGLTGLASDAVQQADCVVVCGGASVGRYDFARAMFAKTGLEEILTKVAIKPGKPVWIGKSAGKPVLGLPGNPTSAMVTARLFLRPMLAALQGGSMDTELVGQLMPLALSLPETGSRETFFRARGGPDGLIPLDNRYSGAQSPLLFADWLIRRSANAAACEAGDLVQTLDF